ncbi:hypothetical protein DTO271D3_5755 [Paecilomyces variotii]|nr:hypothetical protein DTO169C6_8540 [Paecilomyces variotii]KAJ9240861.1 hypothetical protein DTO169E5_3778 [Paecilomyces variotii]KAJ9259076.1 hypothetical protein DTO207G8_1236 [Paecilomyces variotii]KAJ9314067.1 hypothetical protein DTO271D3_5755 [Paecilomyces variotii]KAJ9383917.1 hypothetical protein DTO063F5_5021 [Paecilomyces variotii]
MAAERALPAQSVAAPGRYLQRTSAESPPANSPEITLPAVVFATMSLRPLDLIQRQLMSLQIDLGSTAAARSTPCGRLPFKLSRKLLHVSSLPVEREMDLTTG